MSDRNGTVCPWCQMEIVWDEELGPEDTCPHCFNELTDYRSLHVRLEGDELKLSTEEQPGNLLELSGYEAAVRQRLEQQEDSVECIRCQDEMVLAGTQRIDTDTFIPLIPEGLTRAFLKPPFTVNTFVCPSCFHLAYTLSDEDRVRLAEEWSNPEP